MAEYVGLSLRDIYLKKCDEAHCKPNSLLKNSLPTQPDYYDSPVHLDVSQNFVGPKGIVPLLEVVRCCTGLLSLDLRDQQMSNDTCERVCVVLSRHPSLTKLNLSNNPLTISAGRSLVELCKNNAIIEHILLDNTEIRSVMINTINAQLAKNRKAKAPGASSSSSTAADQQHQEEEQRVQIASKTRDELNAMGTVDQSVLRSALASYANSVAEILFDENVAAPLTTLCNQFNSLFYDVQFAPKSQSVQRSVAVEDSDAEWRRLSHICSAATPSSGDGNSSEPMLFPDQNPLQLPKSSRASHSWVFTSLFACLPNHDSIRKLITPNTYNPCGVYTVKFFIDGEWRYVVVDDFVPVAADGSCIFTAPVDGVYFWPCIIEKAVAKLHYSYQATDMSVTVKHPIEKTISCAVTMGDFSAGYAISRDLHHEDFNSELWWATMLEQHNDGDTYLVASSKSQDDSVMQTQGITPAHAYQIKHVRQINGFKLLMLESHFCDRTWKGEWSDTSVLWQQYPDIASALDIANVRTTDPHAFWIPFVKFLQLFSGVHVCRCFHNCHSRMVEGEWNRATAGGPYFEQSWTQNPRYKLALKSRGSVFVALSTPDTRFHKTDIDTLAFHVLRSDYYPIRFDKDKLCARTNYIITNSVSYSGVFEEDDHWVVPSSYVKGRLGRFFVRVFSTSAFLLRCEDPRTYWKEQKFSCDVESSGAYQSGEDNTQYSLTMRSGTDPSRLLVRLHTPESEQFSLALFLCQCPQPSRIIGNIPEDQIVARSKFLISNTVTLEALIPPASTDGANYVVVPCINPEKSRGKIAMTFWCNNTSFAVQELPLWKRKSVTCEWATSSGGYQDTTNNPQVELVTPIPNQTFVITMSVQGCTDPSIIFFVVSNKGRQGDGMKGRVPDNKVLVKSTYIRHESVTKEFFNGPSPQDSYVILPCLQPPGSKGKCTITVSCSSEDFILRAVQPAD